MAVAFLFDLGYNNHVNRKGGKNMCTVNELNLISNEIADEAKAVLGDLLEAVVLYGSYARGDFDDESDLDIMIRIDCPKEQLNAFKQKFIRIASELSLKYGIEVSFSLADTTTYRRYKNHLPYYENIESEGIKIA